jgi:BatD DUF11 like domain
MVARYFFYLLLAALALVRFETAHAAELSANVDRKELVLQEHVAFSLSLINSDIRLRAQGISPNVDLSVLTKDFDIGTPHVDNRYNIYRGQGRSTSELTVDLFPRHPGQLTIPAFSVGGLSTTPITIIAHPLPSGSMPEIFSKAGISASQIWQRQQVVTWLDVYHRVQLKTASIGEYIETEPSAIELLEHQDLPQSERKEDVRGITYDVTRIAWSIFPKQSGTLTIHLPDVWAVTKDGRKLRLPQQQQHVKVKALPADVTADIAVGTPILTQTTPSPAPSINNVSTWTITVRGPFSRFAMPDTLPLATTPDHIKVYSDHGRRDTEAVTGGLTTVVKYTLSALPQNDGAFKLPPLRIPYFNPSRGTMAIAELPGQTFTVTAATMSPPTKSQLTEIQSTSKQMSGKEGHKFSLWQATTVLFAALWIITLVWLWKRSHKITTNDNLSIQTVRDLPPPTIHHPLQAQLLAAFGSRTLEQGLNAWESRHGSDEQLRDIVRSVQQLCFGNGNDKDTSTLSRTVENAVAKIRAKESRNIISEIDPWRPESFTASPVRK